MTDSILFLFVDGVGLGSDDPNVNPLASDAYPALSALGGGALTANGMAPLADPDHLAKPIDPNLGLMSILLTPNGDAKVWYEKDNEENTLTFYSDRAEEVSYRLTAPRFDHEKWPTYVPNKSGQGFKVPN